MKLYNHAGRSLNMVFYEESKPRQWRKTHLSFQFENCQPLRFGMVRHLHVGFDVFEHCPPNSSLSGTAVTRATRTAYFHCLKWWRW